MCPGSASKAVSAFDAAVSIHEPMFLPHPFDNDVPQEKTGTASV
jgi:hypothetical protein